VSAKPSLGVLLGQNFGALPNHVVPNVGRVEARQLAAPDRIPKIGQANENGPVLRFNAWAA
jgi:hypothetical protein